MFTGNAVKKSLVDKLTTANVVNCDYQNVGHRYATYKALRSLNTNRWQPESFDKSWIPVWFKCGIWPAKKK